MPAIWGGLAGRKERRSHVVEFLGLREEAIRGGENDPDSRWLETVLLAKTTLGGERKGANVR